MKIKDSLFSSPILSSLSLSLYLFSSFSMERSCVQKILFGEEKKDMCHRFVMSVFLGKREREREKKMRMKEPNRNWNSSFHLSLSLSLSFFPNRKTSSTNATYRKEIVTIHFVIASKGRYHRYWHEYVNIQYKKTSSLSSLFRSMSTFSFSLSLSLSYKKLSRKKVYLSRWRNKKERNNNRTKTWRDKKKKEKKEETSLVEKQILRRKSPCNNFSIRSQIPQSTKRSSFLSFSPSLPGREKRIMPTNKWE